MCHLPQSSVKPPGLTPLAAPGAPGDLKAAEGSGALVPLEVGSPEGSRMGQTSVRHVLYMPNPLRVVTAICSAVGGKHAFRRPTVSLYDEQLQVPVAQGTKEGMDILLGVAFGVHMACILHAFDHVSF